MSWKGQPTAYRSGGLVVLGVPLPAPHRKQDSLTRGQFSALDLCIFRPAKRRALPCSPPFSLLPLPVPQVLPSGPPPPGRLWDPSAECGRRPGPRGAASSHSISSRRASLWGRRGPLPSRTCFLGRRGAKWGAMSRSETHPHSGWRAAAAESVLTDTSGRLRPRRGSTEHFTGGGRLASGARRAHPRCKPLPARVLRPQGGA